MYLQELKSAIHRHKRNIPRYIDTAMASFVDPKSTVIITGFWRSGTTWLQRIMAEHLHAKTIFEPMEVDVYQRYHIWGDAALQTKTDLYIRAHMPFVEDIIPRESGLYCLLADALRGKIDGKRVRMNRNNTLDAFRTRVVVKIVRGQLAIRGIQNTFQAPMIHIHRDPRAVVASILRHQWGGEWLQQLSLRDQLLTPEDGRASFFNKWSAEIDFFDRKNWLEKVAVYWALTEKYVESCYEKHNLPGYILSYEALVTGGEQVLLDGLEKAGVKASLDKTTLFDKSSPTTALSRQGISNKERLFGWEKELPAESIAKIIDIVKLFDLTSRLEGYSQRSDPA